MAKRFDKVKQTEIKEDFSTGSVRGIRTGKGRFDLIPPYALLRLAIHYENGASAYGDRNWEKGQPLGRYLDSALRHLNCVRMGMDDEDHLSAVAWNVMAIVETQYRIEKGILPKELDDLPEPYKDASC